MCAVHDSGAAVVGVPFRGGEQNDILMWLLTIEE
jgi:hypothetical protein